MAVGDLYPFSSLIDITEKTDKYFSSPGCYDDVIANWKMENLTATKSENKGKILYGARKIWEIYLITIQSWVRSSEKKVDQTLETITDYEDMLYRKT